jgi:hypothetical protein
MTLEQFLTANTPLTFVELLPDNRLINVVIGDGALHGVQVENIPSGVSVTRFAATYAASMITANALTFDARDYVMLGDDSAEP